MHSRFRMKCVMLATVLAVAASTVLAGSANAEPAPGVKKKGFRLFARAIGAMTVNRVLCGVAADGRLCVDSLNSSTIGGGYWPKGTADQYIFQSGLQVAAIIGPDGGPWAGDTTGGFFVNTTGSNEHGQLVEPVYNAQSAADRATWPAAACVPNGDAGELLFDPLLRTDVSNLADPNCRKSASQGDLWLMSWEGDPSLSGGRSHPLGVAVETRALGWNFPAGNEDIIYFIFTFFNITSLNSADYAAIRPSLAAILQQKASDFHAAVGSKGTVLPQGGYTMTNMYAAVTSDMDVAEASSNYASVNLPFAMGYTYDHAFSQPPAWTFDPHIFSAPFFQGAGFVGVKYLKSPTGAGAIQLFSNTANAPLPPGSIGDAGDVTQLYRYLSGQLSPGDGSCNIPGVPAVTHVCYVGVNAPFDARFFQSSTALTLPPGASGSIVVAYIHAAPVATASCGAGCDVNPGNPLLLTNAVQLGANGGTANVIDSLTGFKGYSDVNSDGIVQQDEFSVVAGSLLGKAGVAQSVFDNKFLLPFAPESPEFFLVPGDHQVTVLWKPSTSETAGDPFFAVAQQPTVLDAGGNVVANTLYDPNYRQFDIEGYRVYRGRVDAPNELQLLAQFDYSGTTITDYAGQVFPTDECAPELSIRVSCPVPFDSVGPGLARFTNIAYELTGTPLIGNVIQVQFGKRAALLSGKVIITSADTAVSGGGTSGSCAPSACPVLRNTGVPFVYTDATPRNNFRYFYAVTAFDINSFQSSPSSLESPRITKPATPVVAASNYSSVGSVVSSELFGRSVRNTSAPLPTINATTGVFSGPFPASNAWSIGLGAFVSQVLAQPGNLAATLDSITVGAAYADIPHQYWFTASANGQSLTFSIPLEQPDEIGTTTGSVAFSAVPIDSAQAAIYGGLGTYKLPGQVQISTVGPDYLSLWGRGCVNGRDGYTTSAGCSYNGSRFFNGNTETLANPNGCNTANFSNVPMTCYNNSGEATGAATIFQAQCYQSAGGNGCRQLTGITSGVWRAGDFKVYWGNGGVIDSVIDATTDIPVPGPLDGYADHATATWGILNPAAAVAPSPDASTSLTNKDFACVEPFRTLAQGSFTCPAGTPAYLLSNTAQPGPVGFFSGGSYPPTVPVVPATNNGIGLYIVGDMFTIEFTGGVVPPSGTVWTLRKYVGAITGGNGSGGDEGPFAYSNPEAFLPLTALGAQIRVNFTVTNTVSAPTFAGLKAVHTVPDPYYVTNEFEQSTDNKVIKFVNLPQRAIIRIYSSSGILVNILEHNSATFGGDETWNVRNRNNQVVASGVYFYHIEANGVSGGTARRVGRMTIVNFAQ